MLLDEARKAMFARDTLRVEGGRVVGAPRHFSWDERKKKESIRRVARLQVDLVLPGHGKLLTSGASEAVREFASQR